jgi:hypothetical protein
MDNEGYQTIPPVKKILQEWLKTAGISRYHKRLYTMTIDNKMYSELVPTIKALI